MEEARKINMTRLFVALLITALGFVVSPVLAGRAVAAVSLNAAGTEQTGSSVTSLNYTNITVASGSNRALVLACSFQAIVSSVTATWDSGGTNQSMTLVKSQNNSTNGRVTYLFGLLAPTTGNLTLAVSWTTSTNAGCSAVAFNGVIQIDTATAFTNAVGGSGNGVAPSLAVTTSNGDATVSSVVQSGSPGTASFTTFMLNTSNGYGAQYNLSTGTTDTHTWTGTANHGIAGIRVNQVAAAAARRPIAPIIFP